MQQQVKIKQKKSTKKCNKKLKSEMYKNSDLLIKLKEYKDKLKSCEQEKEYLRKECFLKFQKIETKTLHMIDLFKFVESMAMDREISHTKAYYHIDTLLKYLKFHIRASFR